MLSSNIANCIGLILLATHWKYFDVVSIYKLIKSMINCYELLLQIGFRVPTFNSKHMTSFDILYSTKNPIINCYICCLLKSRATN